MKLWASIASASYASASTGVRRPSAEAYDQTRPVVSWQGFDESRIPLPEHVANARLIALAPELAAALAEAQAEIERLILTEEEQKLVEAFRANHPIMTRTAAKQGVRITADVEFEDGPRIVIEPDPDIVAEQARLKADIAAEIAWHEGEKARNGKFSLFYAPGHPPCRAAKRRGDRVLMEIIVNTTGRPGDPRLEAVAKVIAGMCSDGNADPYRVAAAVLAALRTGPAIDAMVDAYVQRLADLDDVPRDEITGNVEDEIRACLLSAIGDPGHPREDICPTCDGLGVVPAQPESGEAE